MFEMPPRLRAMRPSGPANRTMSAYGTSGAAWPPAAISAARKSESTGRPVRSAMTAASASCIVHARLHGSAGSGTPTCATVCPCDAMRSTSWRRVRAFRTAATAAAANILAEQVVQRRDRLRGRGLREHVHDARPDLGRVRDRHVGDQPDLRAVGIGARARRPTARSVRDLHQGRGNAVRGGAGDQADDPLGRLRADADPRVLARARCSPRPCRRGAGARGRAPPHRHRGPSPSARRTLPASSRRRAASSGPMPRPSITIATGTRPPARSSAADGGGRVGVGGGGDDQDRAAAQLLVRCLHVDHQVAVDLPELHHREGAQHIQDELLRGPGFEARAAGDDLGTRQRRDRDLARRFERRGGGAREGDRRGAALARPAHRAQHKRRLAARGDADHRVVRAHLPGVHLARTCGGVILGALDGREQRARAPGDHRLDKVGGRAERRRALGGVQRGHAPARPRAHVHEAAAASERVCDSRGGLGDMRQLVFHRLRDAVVLRVHQARLFDHWQRVEVTRPVVDRLGQGIARLCHAAPPEWNPRAPVTSESAGPRDHAARRRAD